MLATTLTMLDATNTVNVTGGLVDAVGVGVGVSVGWVECVGVGVGLIAVGVGVGVGVGGFVVLSKNPSLYIMKPAADEDTIIAAKTNAANLPIILYLSMLSASHIDGI
jgi:hypothetical protein